MHVVAVASGVAALFAATLFLTGCTPLETSSDDSPPSAFEHVHELSAGSSDGSVIVATHEGLFRVTADLDGGAVVSGPIGSIDFDPMGFTMSDGIAYASGHPGPTTPSSLGAPDLGLITSTNLEQGWANVSLTGEADFHSLAVQTDGETVRVFGFDAGNGPHQKQCRRRRNVDRRHPAPSSRPARDGRSPLRHHARWTRRQHGPRRIVYRGPSGTGAVPDHRRRIQLPGGRRHFGHALVQDSRRRMVPRSYRRGDP